MTAPTDPVPAEPRRTAGHRRAPAPAVHAAELPCEVCGRETPHRLLHLNPGATPLRFSGIARCQECRTTHPFQSEAPRSVAVRVVLSDGPSSHRVVRELPRGRILAVGELLPGNGPTARIHRIERRDGSSPPTVPTEAALTVWATVDRGAVVPVSVVDGPRTEPHRLLLPPSTLLRVGDPLKVDGLPLTISGLRARHQTWSYPGDAFPASSVERVYARRYVRPPAGSIGWSTPRDKPISRARATSTSGRARSSPGERTARSSPRARSASGGATPHSSSFS